MKRQAAITDYRVTGTDRALNAQGVMERFSVVVRARGVVEAQTKVRNERCTTRKDILITNTQEAGR